MGSIARSADKVAITGRLLYEDKSPIVDILVMVMEAQSKDGKLTETLKVGPGGKYTNPSAHTDETGRFLIEADPAFWAGTGRFTLRGGLIPGTMTNAGLLRGPGDTPLLLSIAAKKSKLDLGDIIVKEQ
jgi:hypothetical protein